MPSAIRAAASGGSIRNGMRNVFCAVRSLRTNPGQTVSTRMPRGSRSMRRDSSRLISAALVLP